ncbi:endonuclease/exonuclease/phosphatase family protein [Nocardioides piscis]|uniref:endonuclease/exonuclease/phosphatase family protein n=1 Tax=Nocardioides piscis TaxID=2714938 RepID=UPI001FEBCB62|nr:endonuclease/exonuclease/phosphatase family protein [Nocardioides piscis]
MGDGKVGPDVSAPQAVRGGKKWRSVSSGGASTCGIKNSGKLFCWGLNHRGQIGDGSTKVRAKPVVVSKKTKWKSVDASWFNTCAITSKKKLFCWGDNAASQLGPKTRAKQSPKPVKLPGGRWTTVSVGSRFVCGTKTDGSLRCWGGNLFGQLGTGSYAGKSRPVRIGGSTSWAEVSTSWTHTCARSTAGAVQCWGRNTYGALGNGNVTTTPSPQTVLGNHKAVDLATFEGGSCLLDDKGQAWCWGNNAYGLIGDGSVPFTAEPVAGPSGLTEIEGGWRHVCGLTATGSTCWGANDRAQLGNGTLTSSPSPLEVEPLPAPDPAGATDFRIATVNALGNGHTRPYAHDDAFAPATTRMSWLADQLDNSAIDIMGLQEPNSDQMFHFLKAARGTWDVWPRPESGDDAVEAPLAWRTSVWEAVEKTTLTTQFISKELPRPLVRLRHRITGKEIWVLNVHNAPWDYQFKRDKATRVQLAKINELRATGVPVFYIGDMNEKRTLLCNVLKKTDLVSPYGGSYDPVTKRCTNPPSRMRVDWIFGSPEAAYSNFEYTRPPLLSLVTDHNMALVDVRLP